MDCRETGGEAHPQKGARPNPRPCRYRGQKMSKEKATSSAIRRGVHLANQTGLFGSVLCREDRKEGGESSEEREKKRKDI